MDNKPIAQLFIDALREIPPDFTKAEQLLLQGMDINAVSPEEDDQNILSSLILGYPESRSLRDTACDSCEDNSCEGCSLYAPTDGRYLPQIIQFCLDHGFDVNKENGSAGAKCLENLTWASYDDFILEGTKLLLDAGANPEGDPNPEETEQFGFCENVISWVGTKCSGEIAANDDYESSNRFCVMYDIMDAAIKGKDYHAVFNCYQCIGKKVQGIELCCAATEHSLEADPLDSYCPPSPLIFDCEGLPLCLHNKYVELYVGHVVASEIPGRSAAVSPILTWCLGRTITDVIITPQGYEDNRPVSITISFDDGNALYITYSDKQAIITRVPSNNATEGRRATDGYQG